MITSFSHIYLPARDTAATIAFYTENLGFSVFRRWISGDGRELAYLRLGDVLLEVSEPASGDSVVDQAAVAQPRFGLTVSGGMDQLLDRLRRNGVEVLPEGATPPRSFLGRQVRIKDPSGWLIALREWRHPDGPHNTDWPPTS